LALYDHRVRALLLVAFAAWGCSGPQPAAGASAPVSVAREQVARAASEQPASSWPFPRIDEEQLKLPDDAPCRIGPEQVTPHDVRWLLRSRERRQATMRVRHGTVTAFMGLDAVAIVQVETATARIRGLAASARAVSRRPFLHDGHFVPDGVRDHGIALREDGDLNVWLSYLPGEARRQPLPCSEVTLQRRQLDGSHVLPPALRPVVVAQESDIELGGETMPLAAFTVTHGSQQPLGALATLHAGGPPNGRAWVSIGICGGTLFGTVPASALLGQAREQPWRLPGCLDIDHDPTPKPPALERPLRCDRELTLFVRQRDYLDAVGVTKPGASIQVEGGAHEGRVFVTLADAPVELSPEVSRFELNKSHVAQHCRAAR
jgi:hypothetical protein